jgi:mycofactocin precursor
VVVDTGSTTLAASHQRGASGFGPHIGTIAAMDEVILADDMTTVTTETTDTSDVTGELLEELLVEEISIDGMCGVY